MAEAKDCKELAEEYSKYMKVKETAIHITASDRPNIKFMAWVYDIKKYMWINADVYADTEQNCIDIIETIFGEVRQRDDELKITIDYGDNEDDGNDLEKLEKIQDQLNEMSSRYEDYAINNKLFDIGWDIKKLLGMINN